MFFQTVFVAIIALVLGLAMCFAGFRLFVILLPIWAFFAGFAATAEAIQQLFGGGFLSTIGSWVFGVVIGVVFAVAAYFFYYAAVVVLAGTVGYEIGAGIMIGFGVSSGFLQFIVGLAVAVALAAAVVFLNLPKVFVVLLTAFAGAQAVLFGVLLALHRITLVESRWGLVGVYIRHSWFWGAIYMAIAVLGIIAQLLTPSVFELKPYGEELSSFQAPTPAANESAQPVATRPSPDIGPEVPAT